ncbi:guanylate kinase [Candidatus Pacearchaeota archaeon]|nr:guanylate kinase [Candidatus Pacearchaeota archaeon]
MEGCLITFIGPSGVGKSVILNRLIERYPELINRSISTTTRKKRPNEDDSDFYFKTKKEFLEMINNGEFLEYNDYVGNYYGTSFESILPFLDEGKNVFKVIEVNGLKSIKDSARMNSRKHISIFINTPSRGERENRIRNRGKLSEEEIIARLKTGDEELKFYYANERYFNHYIVNDDLDSALEQILNIIRGI